MLKTVSSKQSLVLFKHNRNSSNIFADGVRSIQLILKEDYASLFSKMHSLLSSGIEYTSFVDLWKKLCAEACKQLESKISSYADGNQDDIKRVSTKFRGNLGEIFAEAFFSSGLASEYFDGSTYEPVDPDNERFFDAKVKMHDGVEACIQIKNYAIADVDKETFWKAAAEDRYQLDEIGESETIVYLSSPRQFIFSFTETKKIFIEDHIGIVAFLGPKYIDSKKIQGDIKQHIIARANMFKSIADEIASLREEDFR